MLTLPLTSLLVCSALALGSSENTGAPDSGSEVKTASRATGENRLRELSDEVTQLLEQALRTRGATAEEMVPQMVDLYRRLDEDQSLTTADKRRLQLRLKTRLAQYQSSLERRVARSKSSRQGGTLSGGGSFGNAGELIDLIRTTIAPGTWDIDGGPGRIFYFRGVLIIHQTDEAHTEIASALQQFRR